jgi:hypothetical protein
MTDASRTAFVSYSHDSDVHRLRTIEFVERLRADGIDCDVDAYEEAPPEGWPAWTLRKISESDYVLMVCTPTYHQRVTGQEKAGVGLGARWEGSQITQALYDAGGRNEKFIPVVYSTQYKAYIPSFVESATHYDLSTRDGYELLYRRLTKQPRYPRRPLGAMRHLAPESLSRQGLEGHAKQDFNRGQSSKQAAPSRPSRQGATRRGGQIGELVLIARDNLKPHFTTAISIQTGQSISMVLAPGTGSERAFIEDLAKPAVGTVTIAYGLTAVTATVKSIRHVRERGREQYHAEFEPTDRTFGLTVTQISTPGYTPDDLALLRARRILLDERLPSLGSGTEAVHSGSSMIEPLVRGLGCRLSVEHSPLPRLRGKLPASRATFISMSKLVAVVWLRLTGTVEHVVELEMVLDKHKVVKVHFRGLRHQPYMNRDPVELVVDGSRSFE